jgi:hypothetical protein
MELGDVEPHYSLEEAASRFFPGGRITERSLRTEIGNGFLPRKKIAGKFVTCASDVARMLELKQCHEDKKVHASTSRAHGTRRSVWIIKDWREAHQHGLLR